MFGLDVLLPRDCCRYPTRTARFGVALVDSGTLRLKQSQYTDDESPIDDTCDCMACKVLLLNSPVVCNRFIVFDCWIELCDRTTHEQLSAHCF